jgi:hypothetical protein
MTLFNLCVWSTRARVTFPLNNLTVENVRTVALSEVEVTYCNDLSLAYNPSNCS